MDIEQNKTRQPARRKSPTNGNTIGKTKPKKKKLNKFTFILLFIVFIFVSFILGAMIGYGVIGKGEAFDVFKLDTWTHMYNLIFG